MQFPPDFTYPVEKQATALIAAAAIAGLAADRRVVVQAGGCAGLWPLALAGRFDQVYTCEPEPGNFACLKANVATVPTITAYPCAVGATTTQVGLTRPTAQAGLWRVDGAGEIPMVPLDALVSDVPVDALVLDVEGCEVQAWQGAEQVIAAHRPLLWFEYLHDQPAINAFLAAHDYMPPTFGLGGDWYSTHTSRVR
jgi:FkbM family methyltransferase